MKDKIGEKDKKIREKELEILELEKKIGPQKEGKKNFIDKIDCLENRIKNLEKENEDLKSNMKEIKE